MNKYEKVTTYEELTNYILLLDKESDLLSTSIIGQSVKRRDLWAMFFSSSRFGQDTSKIKVLIFAQQHGNEQSGKEAALLLARELLKQENKYLFDRIDLALVPQVNPDGSEINERRNANDMDLNRNHLILTEPETMALHTLFDRFLFEVSMDVHEYSPYGDEWKEYGYRKNADVMLGTNTNPNVSNEIRKLSDDHYLPYIFSYLNNLGFSSFVYCPGGPPGASYIRHSTFDINDGRQSLGIQNTFSFIQEGMNGTDSYLDNLQYRAESQMAGMRGLLEYVYLNKDRIKVLVDEERSKLVNSEVDPMVSIQSEHIGNGQHLVIPLFSYYSETDSMVTVIDYRPVVGSLYDVPRPYGYLIPKCLAAFTDWAERQSLEITKINDIENFTIERYFITRIDSIDFEGDTIVNPQMAVDKIEDKLSANDYYFIPVAQLKGNLVILALEPKSMLGLATYSQYACLLKRNEYFPVLRVVRK
jgi:hypothetical protein